MAGLIAWCCTAINHMTALGGTNDMSGKTTGLFLKGKEMSRYEHHITVIELSKEFLGSF